MRRAARADLADLVELWLALTRHHAALDARFALRPTAADVAQTLVAEQLRRDDTAIFVVDGDAGALAGYATVRVDEAPPVHAETRRAEIADLFVAPDARRRGIAVALVAAATAWAREAGAERLEARVLVGNRSGQAFWRAQNYGDYMDVLQRRL